jgi:mono/diheme cytochrome c family protein
LKLFQFGKADRRLTQIMIKHSRHILLLFLLAGCDAKSDAIPEGSLANGNSAQGKVLYQQHCSGCHGKSGKGDGPGAKNINPKPIDHTNGHYMSSLNDRYLFTVIRRGGKDIGRPAMPPFPNLSDSEIKDLIAFMRSISSK